MIRSNSRVEWAISGMVLGGLMVSPWACLADDVRTINLPAKSLLWDPGTHRMYATVPGSAPTAGTRANTLTILNPLTGEIVASVPIGAEPGKMALCGSGKYLYVAIDGANAVRVFDIAKQTAGPMISLGAGVTTADIAAVPGYPDSIAVERQHRPGSPSDSGTVVLDADGTVRKNSVPGGHSLLYEPITDRLYGFENEISSYGMRVMGADKDGISQLDYYEGLLVGNAHLVSAHNGLLLSDTGSLVDPISRLKLGQYPGCGYGSRVVGDGMTGRVFLAAGDRGVKITVFDMWTFAPIGTIAGAPTGDAMDLIRWGDDGLAYTDSQGRTVLVRSPLVGVKKRPVDLAISATGLPETFPASGKATSTLTVRNAGDTPAAGVVVSNQLSPNVDIVNMAGSAGTPTKANGVVRLEIPTLAPNAIATLTVQFQLKPQDTTQENPLAAVTQSLFVRSSEPDSSPGNNHLVQTSRFSATAPPSPVAGPDLTGTWVKLSQTSEGAGADLRATVEGEFTVKNIGTEIAPPTRLRFFISGEQVFDPVFSQLLQESGVPELKPGATHKMVLKARLKPGDDAIGLFVIAVVNATNSLTKANKKNNIVPSTAIP